MGQHLTGDLKELDKNLVSKNNTLQGMILNPEAVLKSIPAPQHHQQAPLPQPAITFQTAEQQHTNVVTSPHIIHNVPVNQQPQVDRNQLEFNFETSPLSARIFDTLERIEKKLISLENRLIEIEGIKKKD